MVRQPFFTEEGPKADAKTCFVECVSLFRERSMYGGKVRKK